MAIPRAVSCFEAHDSGEALRDAASEIEYLSVRIKGRGLTRMSRPEHRLLVAARIVNLEACRLEHHGLCWNSDSQQKSTSAPDREQMYCVAGDRSRRMLRGELADKRGQKKHPVLPALRRLPAPVAQYWLPWHLGSACYSSQRGWRGDTDSLLWSRITQPLGMGFSGITCAKACYRHLTPAIDS